MEVDLLIEIKEMPYEEKYMGVLDYVNMLHSFVLPIVERRLGTQKVAEIKTIWQNETEPVPESGHPEERFEIAYNNWMRNWSSAYGFVKANLGDKGVQEFKDEAQRANTDAFKQKAGGLALAMLKLMRTFSPSTAFRTLAKQMSYRLQVFTPFTMPELSREKLVLNAHPCKVADSTNSGVFCTVGCQQIYPAALTPFGVCLTLNPKGKNCTITLTRS